MANKTLQPGTLLQGGKYKIEKVLGQGTFGITYLAAYSTVVEGSLGKMNAEIKVAVKEFFMNEVNQRAEGSSAVEGSGSTIFTNYRNKFRKEAQNMATLHHPHIVQVTDVFDENSTSYYVMQYIDGLSLDAYIHQKKRLPETEAIGIAAQTAQALTYMHARHMLHLDLKPGNVMMDREGNVHLIDFGLSKQYDNNGEPESSTSIGLGTPGYAPLEQARGASREKTFQATIDVYALGATLYKMLTGQRPADASVILNDGFPSAYMQQLGISRRTAQAVEKAMAPARRDRFATAADVIAALTDEADIEATVIDDINVAPGTQPSSEPTQPQRPKTAQQAQPQPQPQQDDDPVSDTLQSTSRWALGIVTIAITAGLVFFTTRQCTSGQATEAVDTDSAVVDTAAADSTTTDWAVNDSVASDPDAEYYN